MSEQDKARDVGVATGETTYREVMYRRQYADGTSVDSEPAEARPPNGMFELAISLATRNGPKPVSTVRYERTVTVYASEWVPTPEPDRKPLVDLEKLSDMTEGNSAGLSS
jgi:hypothetical protein